eukprot:scaffold53736_cov66-Phaeocystis_antarctica.AAC.1
MQRGRQSKRRPTLYPPRHRAQRALLKVAHRKACLRPVGTKTRSVHLRQAGIHAFQLNTNSSGCSLFSPCEPRLEAHAFVF